MTETTSTPNITALVGNYLAAWNETDARQRRELIHRTFTDHATYLDPLMAGEGHDGIDSMIAAVQQQYPAHAFVAIGDPDTHHDRIRFSWHLIPDGGEPIALGIDFGELAADGRLHHVTGFLEHV